MKSTSDPSSTHPEDALAAAQRRGSDQSGRPAGRRSPSPHRAVLPSGAATRVTVGARAPPGDRDTDRADRPPVPRADHDEIRVGLELLDTLVPGDGYSEQLRLQALIAAEHASARTAGETDWGAIAALYETLDALSGSAIVRLNRAVAVADAESPQAGLAMLDGLDEALRDHHRFAAVCGDLARRTTFMRAETETSGPRRGVGARCRRTGAVEPA